MIKMFLLYLEMQSKSLGKGENEDVGESSESVTTNDGKKTNMLDFTFSISRYL